LRKATGIVIILFILIASCKKYAINDVKVAPWDTEIAFPLINSTFSVQDIFDLNDSSILEYIDEENGLLGITYSGTILSYEASDIIEIADQNLSHAIQYPDPGLSFSFIDTLYQSQLFNVAFDTQDQNEVEVKYFSFLDGSLDLNINSDLAYVTHIQIQIPYLKKNGIPYFFESAVNGGQIINDSEELNAYLMDLTHGDLGYNQLKVNYRLIVNYDPSLPSTGENMAIDLHFNEAKMNYAIGYFGDNTIAFNTDTIKIALFNSTVQGHFQFIDPYMFIDISNSFGFPTQIDVTTFKSVNQNSGLETDLVLEGFTDAPFEISYPAQIGDSTLDEYYFDNTNSNIEVILNDGDKYVIWGIDAHSNPNGPGSNFNFIEHDSKMEVNTRLTIPLKGYAWDWIFKDTTYVNANEVDIDYPDEIEELTLRLIVDNGFPAEGVLQIYTTDSLFQITDSLFDGPAPLLESGILVNGIVSESSKTITDIPISEEKRDHVINAAAFITNAMMQTTNGSEQQVIQIYEDYSVGLLMGVKAKIKIDPDSL
jgi:hypothetical protein